MSAGNWRWRSQPDKEGYRSAQLAVERGWAPKPFMKTIRVKSAREAEKLLAAFVAEIDGRVVAQAPGRMTVTDWLNQWHAQLTFADVTKYNYRSALDRYLIPELGAIKLRELSAARIKAAFLNMAKLGKAPSTLGQIRNVLASALRSAVKFDMIAINPLDKLRGELPIGQSPEAVPAKREAVDSLLAGLPIGDPRRMALYLGLALGLRRGELCGLRWRDIEDGKITIREQIVPVGKEHVTKGPKYGSAREIKIGPKVAEALQQHRRKLAERLLKGGIRLTAADPVCAHDDGRPLRPGSFTGWCARHGIKAHALRHLNASTLIQTEPLPIVAQRLGHSRVDVTLRSYSHLLPGQDDKAAERIDAVI